MKGRLYSFLAVVTIIFFAFLAGFALLHPGLPPTHDGEYHVIRFYEFDKVLRSGVLYPRWAPDLNYGFGVPLFNYVYPLPNYIASIFHFFGVSFIDAFKLQMFIAIIIGAIFFYLWTKLFWGNLGGLVASVFYTFAPYHFVDIYVRGSVGEVWALALFPGFLWSITKYIQLKEKLFIPLSAIFLALVILSHNILALIFFIFSLFYLGMLIYSSKDKKKLLARVLFVLILSLSATAVFWLPAIFEKEYVRGLQINSVDAHFPEIYQLIFPSWGSGFSNSDMQNQMSFQIGIAHLAVFIFSIFVLWKLKSKKNSYYQLILFFITSFITSFFLMLKLTLQIWKVVPFMNYFQFPWRFLSLEILIASFLAGSVVGLWRSKVLASLSVLLVVWLGIGYAQPAYYHNRDDNYYITRSNFIDGTNSPGNVFNTVWMNKDLRRQNKKLAGNKNIVELRSETIKPTDYKFVLTAKEDAEITVNTAYFPGWVAFIDGIKAEVNSNRNGLISFDVPKGKRVIAVKLVDTPMQSLGKIISLLSLMILSALFIRSVYAKIRR